MEMPSNAIMNLMFMNLLKSFITIKFITVWYILLIRSNFNKKKFAIRNLPSLDFLPVAFDVAVDSHPLVTGIPLPGVYGSSVEQNINYKLK